MTDQSIEQATSTELAGGTGFTYEDTVVAYYLMALLREERAAPDHGIVRSVAVQQAGHGYPMDDIIVVREEDGAASTLCLQAKRKIVISAADKDFADILGRAVETRAAASFDAARDYYGFAVENVARGRLRTLSRLIEWAKASPTGDHFVARFAPGGSAAAAERKMRLDLLPALMASSPEEERRFYDRFVALELSGLTPGGLLRTDMVNRLQELVASNEDGQDLLLFDRLCRIAREGAGAAQKWTRGSLLALSGISAIETDLAS